MGLAPSHHGMARDSPSGRRGKPRPSASGFQHPQGGAHAVEARSDPWLGAPTRLLKTSFPPGAAHHPREARPPCHHFLFPTETTSTSLFNNKTRQNTVSLKWVPWSTCLARCPMNWVPWSNRFGETCGLSPTNQMLVLQGLGKSLGRDLVHLV